jgi:magnesium chelatase subunit D
VIGLGPTLGQIPWQEKLRRTLARHRGVRLGESTVVSRQVHVSEPNRPQVVTILSTADAGAAFYGRTEAGEIIHLDIFHAVADVDHRKVAGALRHALAGMVPADDAQGGKLLLDHFDLVTGTGGGRVTGDLSHCRKESLRAAHRNHVHLAGRLPEEQLSLLVLMVRAVEGEIRAQGVEIRRIEKLNHSRWSNAAPLDLSHYTDSSDSWLRGQNPPGGQAGKSVGGGGGAAQSLRSGRNGGSGGAPVGGAPPAAPAENLAPSEAEPTPDTGWGKLDEERRMQAAVELSSRLGSPDEVRRVLDELGREQGWASLYGSGSSQAPYVIRQLEEDGLVKRELSGLRLTAEGKALATYMEQHVRDVKLRFRKQVRRIPSLDAKKSRKPGPSKSPPSPDVRYGPIRGTAPAEPGAWLGDVAVPETIRAALTRTYQEQIETGRPRAGLRLTRRDVHVYLRSGEQPLHICLLIDASASMAGRRILAAKHLARHLLVSTRDRIAVIGFQEREVRVYVPFTRDYAQLEDGLTRIQPMGLTPLAHGLTQSVDLIRASNVRRPLLLLITDGIPTVPKWSIDPLGDGLEAGRLVGQDRVPFGCIGLQPSRRYLEELAKVAGGTLHVVEELNEEALVTIAHRERSKLAQRVGKH